MWLARPVVPVPFLVVAVSGRPFHEVFAGSSISCLSAIGGWIVTEKLLLFSLTVVSAVFGGCKTASGGSPSSTGFEPGADKAADPSGEMIMTPTCVSFISHPGEDRDPSPGFHPLDYGSRTQHAPSRRPVMFRVRRRFPVGSLSQSSCRVPPVCVHIS